MLTTQVIVTLDVKCGETLMWYFQNWATRLSGNSYSFPLVVQEKIQDQHVLHPYKIDQRMALHVPNKTQSFKYLNMAAFCDVVPCSVVEVGPSSGRRTCSQSSDNFILIAMLHHRPPVMLLLFTARRAVRFLNHLLD
jgi:hypothetical protein